jgi:hypothetical protein
VNPRAYPASTPCLSWICHTTVTLVQRSCATVASRSCLCRESVPTGGFDENKTASTAMGGGCGWGMRSLVRFLSRLHAFNAVRWVAR